VKPAGKRALLALVPHQLTLRWKFRELGMCTRRLVLNELVLLTAQWPRIGLVNASLYVARKLSPKTGSSLNEIVMVPFPDQWPTNVFVQLAQPSELCV